jgi:membrane-bound lytic murein transglycosylase B
MWRLLFSAAVTFTLMQQSALADPKFESYIQSLWPKVKAAGISRDLFDRAFTGITDPDQSVLTLARKQPEFTSTTSAYLAKAVTAIRIDSGQSMKSTDALLLAAIEKKYGVDRHILLGIWGMESNFGKDKGSMSVMRSLATLMYEGTRRRYAESQLIAAFRILEKGARTPDSFTGSWAAAMGHTQFIPTSYLAYAVDWTGDGKRDIWNSKEDALASTANYLAKAGWKSDRPWGWEVEVPEGFNRALIGRTKWRSVSEWEKLGVKPAGLPAFSVKSARAFMMIPQGINGPAFLVTDNFLAIMDYNLSHSYAVAVGHLADRIRGGAGIKAAWPDVQVNLTLGQRVEIQKRLSGMGFETGGSDGRFGARTYEAVLLFQKAKGLPLDGEPNVKLLKQLQGGGQ